MDNPAHQQHPERSVLKRLTAKTNEFLDERKGHLPVWIRAPKKGTEFYTGLSRSKLYEAAARNRIRSVSIREPGQVKGTRLFELQSVFDYIHRCEQRAYSERLQSRE